MSHHIHTVPSRVYFVMNVSWLMVTWLKAWTHELTDARDEFTEEVVGKERLLKFPEEELQCSCDHMNIPATLLQVQILCRETRDSVNDTIQARDTGFSNTHAIEEKTLDSVRNTRFSKWQRLISDAWISNLHMIQWETQDSARNKWFNDKHAILWETRFNVTHMIQLHQKHF